MDNKQLLERAAKAAGYTFCADRDDNLVISSLAGWQQWNPINNDADAFRLMVDCGIDVTFNRHCLMASRYDFLNMCRSDPVSEEFNNNKHAATRMAIVRAAAQSQERAHNECD